jgi:hypothetical protein
LESCISFGITNAYYSSISAVVGFAFDFCFRKQNFKDAVLNNVKRAVCNGLGSTIGAALGSVFPVVGTAVGGFLGGLVGSFVSKWFFENKSTEK